MDLLQLKYFQKVAQLKHLTKAAEELYITQPALSQTISRLERDLGVSLFDREGRQIRLNEYGEAFLKKVDIALNTLEEGKRELRDMAGLEKGTVSIDSSSLPYFPEAINAFRASFPDVRFRVSQVSTREAKEELLENGGIDLCISCSPVKRKGIVNYPIVDENIFFAVPLSHRLADRQSIKLSEVAEEPFMSFKKGHSFREQTDELCQLAGFEPNIICEVDDLNTMKQLMKSGIGVAFWLESLIDTDCDYRPLSIEEPVSIRTYYLSWTEKRYLSLASRSFRDWLMEHFHGTKSS
ncbi:LysR family transcriptional regulator [Paenibacillus sp. GCM10027627]|uniref:LysR family transcriptional regulator n=1 Tax=unclassified Paenibacillus TaxID=185978 RepID=UPI00363A0098